MDIEKEFDSSHKQLAVQVYDKYICEKFVVQVQVAKWGNKNSFCIPDENLPINQYSHVGVTIYNYEKYLDHHRGDNLHLDDLKDLGLGFLVRHTQWSNTFFSKISLDQLDEIVRTLTNIAGGTAIISNSQVDYSKCPCEKCGLIDTYNGPSAKHNNSIRCYQHC